MPLLPLLPLLQCYHGWTSPYHFHCSIVVKFKICFTNTCCLVKNGLTSLTTWNIHMMWNIFDQTKVDLEVWLKTSSSSFPPFSLCRRPVEQVGGLPLRGEAGREKSSRSIVHYCTLSFSAVWTNTIWISTDSQRSIQRWSSWVTILQGQGRSRHLPESTSQDDHSSLSMITHMFLFCLNIDPVQDGLHHHVAQRDRLNKLQQAC